MMLIATVTIYYDDSDEFNDSDRQSICVPKALFNAVRFSDYCAILRLLKKFGKIQPLLALFELC